MTNPSKASIWTRREFVYAGLAFGSKILLASPSTNAGNESIMPDWSLGELEIHQIDTGRGNAMFLLAPDGTTMLLDCGTTNEPLEVIALPHPNASRLPGEWVARYALRRAQAAGRSTLDYMIASHFHPDHVGLAGWQHVAVGRVVLAGLIVGRDPIQVDFPGQDHISDQLGGELSLDSSAGGGPRVEVVVPLACGRPDEAGARTAVRRSRPCRR